MQEMVSEEVIVIEQGVHSKGICSHKERTNPLDLKVQVVHYTMGCRSHASHQECTLFTSSGLALWCAPCSRGRRIHGGA